jgi:hypothetical protein
MTLEAPMRCSALAEQLGEPMIGSVAHRVRWLLVEDRSAWGDKAVRDVMGAAFEASAKEHGVRLLLVRHREGDPAGDVQRRVILVDTATREAATRTTGDLATLTIEEVAGATIAGFGEPLDGPLFLVCTNGKRDACCALRGRALTAALGVDHGARTWECTHLGGHRFAGNLVCLPDGIVYGRVSPADGPRLAAAYLAGRVDPEHLRGRSAWPAPAQVAELALRRELGLQGIGDVALSAIETSGDAARVTLATADHATHRFELRSERASPRPISCRADETEAPLHWRVVDRS